MRPKSRPFLLLGAGITAFVLFVSVRNSGQTTVGTDENRDRGNNHLAQMPVPTGLGRRRVDLQDEPSGPAFPAGDTGNLGPIGHDTETLPDELVTEVKEMVRVMADSNFEYVEDIERLAGDCEEIAKAMVSRVAYVTGPEADVDLGLSQLDRRFASLGPATVRVAALELAQSEYALVAGEIMSRYEKAQDGCHEHQLITGLSRLPLADRADLVDVPVEEWDLDAYTIQPLLEN